MEADLARREQTRFDEFVSPGLSKTSPSTSKRMPSRPLRNAKDPESEDEESMTESEDEDEDEDEDEEGKDSVNIYRQGKTTASVTSTAGTAVSVKEITDDDREEFLRFMQMKKAKKLVS